MVKRTYLDSSILLAAFTRNDEIGQRAMQILDDPDRQLLVSDAVWLEVMPKPVYEKKQEEIQFYDAVFAAAERIVWNISSLSHATLVASRYGIAALDAIHVAQALDAQAEELLTAEKPSKPMFRVTELQVRSIR